ncbi:synaptic vesicle glycoprotein 2B [Nilaparvata lugens]|uniref:synaptic vesicle glycoprotein 2B n=1 Tax=Nilaparvata lugens TaxID=108931 RepID=UPI000B994AD9|nr:synaptic vesicle glycoprotein 2B [Nilaparvata lugens]
MNVMKPVFYEDVLKRIGYGRCQVTITIVGALCIMCSFMLACVPPYVLPIAQCDLNLTSQDRGTLISAGFVGIIISCHIWGLLSDTLGRRFILSRCLLVDGILYLVNSFAPDFWFFFVVRLLNGISSCGGVVSAYAYIGEFHTKRYRNQSLLIASFIAVNLYYILPGAAFLVYSLDFQLPLFSGKIVYNSWRLFYALCGIPSLVTSLWLFLLPESPKFHLAKNDKEKAMSVIRWIYNKNTGKPGDELVIGDIIIEDRLSSHLDVNGKSSVSSIGKLILAQTVPLFKAPLRFSLFLVCTLQFLIYFCNSGVMMWLPEVLNKIAIYQNQHPDSDGTVCIALESHYHSKDQVPLVKYNTVKRSIISNYSEIVSSTTESSYIFTASTSAASSDQATAECIGQLDFSVFVRTAILGSLSALLLIIIVLVMNVVKRKYALGFCISCSIAGILAVIHFEYMDLLVVELGVVGLFTNVSFPVVTAATVELFPTNLRAMATCLSLMMGRLGTVTANQIAGAFLYSNCVTVHYAYLFSLLMSLILSMFLPSKPRFVEGGSTDKLSQTP